MKNEISTLITGTSGIATVELVSKVPVEEITAIGQTVIQIVIALFTLGKLIHDWRNRNKNLS